MEPVVSPVKVALTLAKDGEGTDEVVTLVLAAQEVAPRRGRPPLWVRELLGCIPNGEEDARYLLLPLLPRLPLLSPSSSSCSSLCWS